MPISLPNVPVWAAVKPRLLRFGGDLTPTLGGPVQRIIRAGSRFSVNVSLPRLEGDDAGAWLAARLKTDASADTARMIWPQPPQSALGAVSVNGGGQAGMALAVTGAGLLKAGRFFSFLKSGRSYLHMVTDAVTLGGGGVLAIAPMLRVVPDSGVSLNFNAPVIDGFFQDEAVAWDIEHLRSIGQDFELSEAE